jgi:hypothetical protein
MLPNPEKRQKDDLLKKAEKIGDLLKLEKVATFNMAWKEPRLDLPGGGECYPLIDVFEKIAEILNTPVVPKKKGGRPKKVKPVEETGTNEV